MQGEKELLQHCIDEGCLMAFYHSTQAVGSEALYTGLKQERTKGKLEILLCDLDGDTALIQDFLLGRQKIADYISK